MSNQLTTINLAGGALAIPEHLINAPSVVGDIPTGDTRTRIGLKGREFHIIRGGVEEGVVETKHLDVILVGAVPFISRQYFDKAFVEGEATAPSCYSVDGNVPAKDVRFPQSEKCMSCPQNMDGSSLNGDKKSKACSFFRRTGVVLPDYDMDTVFQLDVKSMSLWGDSAGAQYAFQEYAKKLKSHNIDAGHVITRLTFDPRQGVPKLMFQAMGYIDAEQLTVVREKVKSGEVNKAIEVSMATFDSSNYPSAVEEAAEPAKPVVQPAKPAPQPRAAAPAPTPAPQAAQPAEDQPAPAPIKRPTLLRPTTQVQQNVPMPETPVEAEEAGPPPPLHINYPPKGRPQLPLRTTRPTAPAPAQSTADDEELSALLSELG